MIEENEQLVNSKIEQISEILKDKEINLDSGYILAKALDKINPEKGMLNYHLEQIDIHSRTISFEKRIEYFDKLFNFLEENNHHTKDNPNISEHDSAWYCRYNHHVRGKVRKVIAIDNMMGSMSFLFIKEEYFIGDDDYSKYYIVRAYSNPNEFLKKDCGKKSLRTLMNNGKLRFFEENYANGDTRLSFDDYKSLNHDMKIFAHDYEKCVLRYDCQNKRCKIYYYFNSSKSCEYALGQLESAFWMRTE